MVGNSLRSDILPVIDAGGWAVYVPAALSWVHEHADLPEGARERCFEIASLAQLPGLIRKL
jgi:putative hydrolase of the HAD superfamily